MIINPRSACGSCALQIRLIHIDDQIVAAEGAEIANFFCHPCHHADADMRLRVLVMIQFIETGRIELVGQVPQAEADSHFDYSTLKGERAYKDGYVADTSSEKFLIEHSKKNPFLFTFHIELTSKCNERCVHCYIPHEYKNADIEHDLMIKALNQCRDMGVVNVSLYSVNCSRLKSQACPYPYRSLSDARFKR